jgi:elongation factor P
MDSATFDQYPLTPELIGDAAQWLKENDDLFVLQYDGKVLGVDLPITAELEVTYTEPGFKGDTATGGTKPATLETGVTVDVPLFVGTGDRIKVDTRTGRYIERA